jgi:K+-transporting ATPase A subunit
MVVVGTAILLVGLTYLPALTLGPAIEQLLLAGTS